MSREVLLLVEAALALLAVLLAVCFVVGVAIAVRPTLLARLRAWSGRTVSTRRLSRPLDVPRDVDRAFYRHHRAFGALIVALSVFVLLSLGLGYDPHSWSGLLAPRYRELELILVDTMRVVLTVLAIFSLGVGVTVFVRPSALKRFEAGANRWLTPRRAMRSLERSIDAPDALAARHPRLWGAGVAVVSALALLALALGAAGG